MVAEPKCACLQVRACSSTLRECGTYWEVELPVEDVSGILRVDALLLESGVQTIELSLDPLIPCADET